jgi:hypothetical protein
VLVFCVSSPLLLSFSPSLLLSFCPLRHFKLYLSSFGGSTYNNKIIKKEDVGDQTQKTNSQKEKIIFLALFRFISLYFALFCFILLSSPLFAFFLVLSLSLSIAFFHFLSNSYLTRFARNINFLNKRFQNKRKVRHANKFHVLIDCFRCQRISSENYIRIC